MKCRHFVRFLLFILALGLATAPQAARACATCFGASDSELAQGMNMGILSLLVIVVCVLGGIATFFVFLARRAAAVHAAAQKLSESTNRA